MINNLSFGVHYCSVTPPPFTDAISIAVSFFMVGWFLGLKNIFVFWCGLLQRYSAAVH